MTYKLKTGDKGKTRGGHAYRVVADDVKRGCYKVMALIDCGDEERHLFCMEDGRVDGGPERRERPEDLMPPVVTRKCWIAHFSDGSVRIFQMPPPKPYGPSVIAMSGPHTIEFTPGEGKEEFERYYREVETEDRVIQNIKDNLPKLKKHNSQLFNVSQILSDEAYEGEC